MKNCLGLAKGTPGVLFHFAVGLFDPMDLLSHLQKMSVETETWEVIKGAKRATLRPTILHWKDRELWTGQGSAVLQAYHREGHDVRASER